MSGTLTFDKDQVLAHATDDGNTLTETSGVKVQKKVWSDEFGDVFDSLHLAEVNPFGDTVGGNYSESGGILQIEQNNLQNVGKSIWTVLYQDPASGEFSIEADIGINFDTPNAGATVFNLYVYYSPTVWWLYQRYKSPTSDLLRIFRYTTARASKTYAYTSFKLRITTYLNGATRYIKFEENDGVHGWVTQLNEAGSIINNGNDHHFLLRKLCTNVGAGKTQEVYINYLRPSDGWVQYWDTKADGSLPDVTFNTLDTGNPGATINCGTATSTEGTDIYYNIKFGTGAWSGVLDLAGIQALGDQITDDGTVQLIMYTGNGTSQDDFTNLNLPWDNPSATSRPRLVDVSGSLETGSPVLSSGMSGSIYAKDKSGLYLPDKRIRKVG